MAFSTTSLTCPTTWQRKLFPAAGSWSHLLFADNLGMYVRTLRTNSKHAKGAQLPGRIPELEKCFASLAWTIVGLQETRQRKKGYRELQSFHSWNSAADASGNYGCSLWIHKAFCMHLRSTLSLFSRAYCGVLLRLLHLEDMFLSFMLLALLHPKMKSRFGGKTLLVLLDHAGPCTYPSLSSPTPMPESAQSQHRVSVPCSLRPQTMLARSFSPSVRLPLLLR